MVEILDAAAQILCPTQESFNTCQQFINEFAYQGPVQQLLFFLFFPTVFIILFVFILTRTLPFLGGGAQGDKAHQGLRLLLSVAFYAFIIVQGWYSIALVLAKFWFVVIIVLAGLWYFVRGHFGGQGGGGAGGHMLGAKGERSILKEMLFGKKLEPWKVGEIVANTRLIEHEKKLLNARMAVLQDELKKFSGPGHEREREHIVASIKNLKQQIAELDKIKKEHYEYTPRREAA